MEKNFFFQFSTLCDLKFITGILHYEIKEMIQKIQNLQKEAQQMNGELAGEMGTSFGLEPTLSNSETPPNENNAAAASIIAKNPSKLPHMHQQQTRPTELIPVHTLVTNVGGGQATVVTKMSSNDAVSQCCQMFC